MGFEWDELPGLLLMTGDGRILGYPDGKELWKLEIEEWVNGLMDGKITNFVE